jgi:uncharacterized protein YndB with AHSA1/START domain
MRHLGVLADSGLVVSRKRGRERRYYLNAVPLQDIYRRWFDPLAAGWATGIVRFQHRVEAEDTPLEARLSVDIAFDVQIGKEPSAVFNALTADPGGWWGHPMLRSQATGLTLEPRLGGLFVEQWRSGGAVLAGVTQWELNRRVELTGPFHLGVGIGVASFELAPNTQGTLLQFSFRAFGPVDPQLAAQFSEGWNELIKGRLKKLAESGTRLGIATEPRPARKTAAATRRIRRDG